MDKIRLILADDHKIIIEGLKGILETEPDIELIGTAYDGREMVEMAHRLKPDVVVTDISMSPLNGIDATKELVDSGSEAKVIILTMHDDAIYASRAFDAGAVGYVLKHSASGELITAIRQVLKGEHYLSPLIDRQVLEDYRRGTTKAGKMMRKITSRQKEVLSLLIKGKTAKEIAAELYISVRTVEFHKYKMMEEFNIESSAELILFAIKNHIVEL